jgi:hypothetical protein
MTTENWRRAKWSFFAFTLCVALMSGMIGYDICQVDLLEYAISCGKVTP